MCNYQYQIPYFKNKSNQCTIPQFFEQYKIVSSENEYTLLHDENGLCLFHSHDTVFKLNNDFEETLKGYIDFCNSQKMEMIDLRGIVICAKEEFQLRNITLLRELNLSKSRIVSPFSVIDCHFHGDLFFDQVICTNLFSIEQTSFSGTFTAMGGTVFNKNVNFSDVTFNGLFDIRDANFMNQVNFNPVTFNGHTVFDNASFRGQNSFIIFSINVNDITSFNQTVFDGPIQMENCKFNADVSFLGTQFNDPFYFANPKINASVSFKESSEAQKIFTSGIEMEIHENCFEDTGQIIFENANLIYLDGKTKTQLKYLEKNRRIVLGNGTEVFKFIFKEKYPYGALDEVLISDLLQKIKQYFDSKLNQQFEFVMLREEDDIVVTFYTDDYARQEDFQADKFESTKSLLLLDQDGGENKDMISQYLGNTFKPIFIETLQLFLEKHIHPNALFQNIKIETLELFLKDSSIQKIETPRLHVGLLEQSQIYVKFLQLENEPTFQLNTTQFESLKIQLLQARFDDDDINFIKQEIKKIKGQTRADDPETISEQLKEFLKEKGIAVGDNIIASTIFQILSKLILGL